MSSKKCALDTISAAMSAATEKKIKQAEQHVSGWAQGDETAAMTRFPMPDREDHRGASTTDHLQPPREHHQPREGDEAKKRERLLFLLEVASDPKLSSLSRAEFKDKIDPSGPKNFVDKTSPTPPSSLAPSALSSDRVQGLSHATADALGAKRSLSASAPAPATSSEEEERKKRRRIEYAMSVLNAGSKEKQRTLKQAVEDARRKRAIASFASLTGQIIDGENDGESALGRDAFTEGDSKKKLGDNGGEQGSKKSKATAKAKASSVDPVPPIKAKKASGAAGTNGKAPKKKRKRRHVRKRTFAEKLMEVLSRPSECGHAVTWLPDGKSFVIVSPQAFTADVLPHYFKTAKFESFTRKLNRWGFKRIVSRDGGGASHAVVYLHEYFRRDAPELCNRMSGGKRDHSLTGADAAASAAAREKEGGEEEDEEENSNVKGVVAEPAPALAEGAFAEQKSPPLQLPSAATPESESPARAVAASILKNPPPALAAAASSAGSSYAPGLPSKDKMLPTFPATGTVLNDALKLCGTPSSFGSAAAVAAGSPLPPSSFYSVLGANYGGSKASAALRAAAAGAAGGFLLPANGRLALPKSSVGGKNVLHLNRVDDLEKLSRPAPPAGAAGVPIASLLASSKAGGGGAGSTGLGKMDQLRLSAAAAAAASGGGPLALEKLLIEGHNSGGASSSSSAAPSSLLRDALPTPQARQQRTDAPSDTLRRALARIAAASGQAQAEAQATPAAARSASSSSSSSAAAAAALVDPASVLRADEERRLCLRRIREGLEVQQQRQQHHHHHHHRQRQQEVPSPGMAHPQQKRREAQQQLLLALKARQQLQQQQRQTYAAI